MKNYLKYFLLFLLVGCTMPLSAQWFNDDMGTAAALNVAPCPWVNTGSACNPAGVTNQGVCATGSSGTPYWLTGATGTSYCWTATTAGNTSCTFTYTLNITGSVTISSITFNTRRSTTGAPNIGSVTINGTAKTPSPAIIPDNSAFNLITIAVSPSITVTNGTLTIVVPMSGASGTSSNWTNRIDDFKIFGTAAPIELSAFDAKPSAAGVHLKWETTIEQNNDYFVIERSNDGLRFDEIGQVKGAGNSVTKQPYDFQDQNPEKGVNYYRLKHVDFDGIFDYSPVRTVRVGSQNLVRVSPNPLKEGAISTVFYESTTEGDLNFIVFNQLGQLVLQKNTTVNKGDNTMDLDLSALPKGIYALQCQSGTDLIETQQIIIK